jgi:hypothetical protein
LSGAQELLGGLIAEGTPWTAGLFQSGWVPSFLSAKADFIAHEATFDGYAEVTPITGFGSIALDSNGQPISYSNSCLFLMTGNTTPNSIGGMFVFDSGSHIIAFWVFNNPIPMNIAGNAINATIALGVTNNGYLDYSF